MTLEELQADDGGGRKVINMDITGGTYLGGLGWVPSSAFHAVVKTCNKPTAANGFSQFWHDFGSSRGLAPFSCAQN